MSAEQGPQRLGGRRTILLAGGLILVALCLACVFWRLRGRTYPTAWKRYAEVGNFSCNYPKGWRIEANGEGIDFKEDFLFPVLYIGPISSGSGESLEGYRKSRELEIRKYFPDYRLLGLDERQVAGTTGVEWEYCMTQTDIGIEWTCEVFFRVRGELWKATMHDLADNSVAAKTCFDSIVRSIVVAH